MTTSSTSYLQTLARDEAIAFAVSLQKVKTHLSQELAWLSQQVQQKNAQLQGVETLLAEATALGFMAATAAPVAAAPPLAATTKAAIAAGAASSGSDLVASSVVAVPASLEPTSNGDTVPTQIVPPGLDVAPPPPARTVAQGKRGLTPTAKTKNSVSAPKASSKASQPAKEPTQSYVRSQFQDRSITDAIGDILKRSRSPLDADAIMGALYEGLSDEAYKRAKNSVTNILSVGRGKGKWKSTGRGLYANNAVATA